MPLSSAILSLVLSSPFNLLPAGDILLSSKAASSLYSLTLRWLIRSLRKSEAKSNYLAPFVVNIFCLILPLFLLISDTYICLVTHMRTLSLTRSSLLRTYATHYAFPSTHLSPTIYNASFIRSLDYPLIGFCLSSLAVLLSLVSCLDIVKELLEFGRKVLRKVESVCIFSVICYNVFRLDLYIDIIVALSSIFFLHISCVFEFELSYRLDFVVIPTNFE